MSAARVARLLAQLAELRDELRATERQAEKLRKRRDALMVRAAAAGASGAAVAASAGVTRGRVSQVAPAEPKSAPARRARRAPAPPVLPAGERELPAVANPLHETAASVRALTHYGARVTAFGRIEGGSARVVTAAGVGLGDWSTRAAVDLLRAADERGVDRLYVYGEELGYERTMRGLSRVEAARTFGLDLDGALVEAGWSTAAAGHYVADADAPVYRWTHERGRTIEVHRFDTWAGGPTQLEPAAVAGAWRELGARIGAAFTGGQLLATPATTGRDLWTRTIGARASYPVLCDELRELIASTSGQGRSELLDARGAWRSINGGTLAGWEAPHVRKLDGLTGVDGRFMYAALTWGMPVGAPLLFSGKLVDQADAELVARRGRWRVRATVPAGWAHVGLLMAPSSDGWRYPARPGETFTTWADASEVQLARRHGWAVELLEGITWAEGKPLNAWTDKLVHVWAELDELGRAGEPGAALAARMVRSIVLHAIGAFAARQHKVTRTLPAERAGELPAGVAPSVLDTAGGPLLTWEEAQPLSPWALNLAHPEWSALVWARARVRLLDAPGGTGALALPAGSVVAFRTDALYVTGAARELVRSWPDDGRPGRFRVELDTDTARPWPATLAELFSIRNDERTAR